ncbi:uncharacterized protein CXorf38 homolog isoform X2 [Eublepharis macularius]|uniref:Uncharacterized protein CXorf38 homolog isoform X2 n=1 Tax=Eublepharis macularius TaxID=481883 RepID=A0AA97J0T0_EUBMA|nr:uncharacterized protein CXorf38 homolog isoform X2 [Eublepharis macularius]
MALAELAARLNCKEYKNWVKAGHSLLLLRAALQRYAGEQVHAFHRQLVARGAARLAPLGRGCAGSCTPRGRQFQPACSLCKAWKKEILNHHTHRNGEVNWGNCRPWLWPSNSWEFAKAYMPRGKVDISGPDKCDASALLNLFNFCDLFSNIDQMKVREVIKCRNELMHSSDMKVSSSWLKTFGNHVQNLLNEFQHVPEAVKARTRIEKFLSSDWDVHVPGEDQLDGSEGEMSQNQISQIEAELIKERLQEISLAMEEQGMMSEQDLNRIQIVKNFLKNNLDLQRTLKAEMQNIETLVQLYSQKQSTKETQEVNCEQEKAEGCPLQKRKCIQ